MTGRPKGKVVPLRAGKVVTLRAGAVAPELTIALARVAASIGALIRRRRYREIEVNRELEVVGSLGGYSVYVSFNTRAEAERLAELLTSIPRPPQRRRRQ